MDMIKALALTGLTGHEASIYMILCNNGELTGYEASKISGISRSNVYLALAGLVDKGGAYIVDGEPVRYSALPPEEYCRNYIRKCSEVAEFIETNIPAKKNLFEPYITIKGMENITNKVKNLIETAKERIYVSAGTGIIQLLKNELEQFANRGLKLVVITDSDFLIKKGIIYKTGKKGGQFRFIADTTFVVTGVTDQQGESSCVYSKNRVMIDLIKDSLTNEIELIKIAQKQSC